MPLTRRTTVMTRRLPTTPTTDSVEKMRVIRSRVSSGYMASGAWQSSSGEKFGGAGSRPAQMASNNCSEEAFTIAEKDHRVFRQKQRKGAGNNPNQGDKKGQGPRCNWRALSLSSDCGLLSYLSWRKGTSSRRKKERRSRMTDRRPNAGKPNKLFSQQRV